MNLETRLPKALWDAVRSNYEKSNYTAAIVDAFYYLSELLRSKSGIDGDGSSLIGQALSGKAPKIKLNRLQTESERSIQQGMEQMLRGLYQCVRNPRSHHKITDSEDDAQTLIMFLGYLVAQIDQAKAPFERSDFVRRVLEPDFVPHQRYAELLVSDVPARARLDVFLDLYQEKEKWNAEHMRLFLKAFIAHLSEDEYRQICEVVTEDLKTSDAESSVRAVVGSFPADFWPRLGEAARLRAENKLIRSVRDGRYDPTAGRCLNGGLGTWSINILAGMTLKAEMTQVIASKIQSGHPEEQEYVFKYFLSHAQKLSETIPKCVAAALCSRLRVGDNDVYLGLQLAPWEEPAWPEYLRNAYSSFQAAETTADVDDEIPF